MERKLRQAKPLVIALIATLIYWLALPPVGLKYLIFVVPAIWRVLIETTASRRHAFASQEYVAPKNFILRKLLGGVYRQYWLASFVFWAVALVWVSYPHPATILGWLALAGYLAFYLPFFIASSCAVKRYLKIPICLAMPISWVCAEYWRNRLLGGFSFAGLSHAIYDQPYLTQLAEPFGEYGVGALIVLVGALLGNAYLSWRSQRTAQSDAVNLTVTNDIASEVATLPTRRSNHAARYVSLAFIALLCAVIYGFARIERINELEYEAQSHNARPLRLALLQDGETYRFPLSKQKNKQISERYVALAFEAAKQSEDFDAIIWPEGTHFIFLIDFPTDFTNLVRERPFETLSPELKDAFPSFANLPQQKRQEVGEDLALDYIDMLVQRRNLARLTARLGRPAILGCETVEFDETREFTCFNSAVFVPYWGDREQVDQLGPQTWTSNPIDTVEHSQDLELKRYDKTQLVMFGEYIPFVKYLPKSWNIQAVCAVMPLGRGRNSTTFELRTSDERARFIIAPHICFESSIPHFIKRQVKEIKSRGEDPDVLLNISNDGWFRNGMQTDLHLATMTYRAIENRRSLVTATHGGFSAWIDAAGRIRSCGGRGQTEVVSAEIFCVKTRPQAYVSTQVAGHALNFDLAEVSAALCAMIGTLPWCATVLVHSARRRREKRAQKATRKQGASKEENSMNV
ncbi:MAG: nitrilase-related carbon-nitrogen hydrolase [Planctomycetia bacterium]|nr:nitrilase-related carbon-nitrogen hydrolase [Planctomycetia bacterium]